MGRLDYLNFDLLFSPDPPGYQARVLASPAGEAKELFSLPFSDQEIDAFLQSLNPARRQYRPNPVDIKDFGTRLFEAAFCGDIGILLQRSQDEAQRNGAHLLIRLRLVDTPELARLPWEYLFHPEWKRFLAYSIETTPVRYLDRPHIRQPLQVSLPLHILVAASTPTILPRLDAEKEWSLLQAALESSVQNGLVTLDRLEEATLTGLQNALRRQEYHIFHFIGHGGIDRGLNENVLFLVDEDGHSLPINGQDLGVLLGDEQSLRLVILNACEGAQGYDEDAFRGIAQSLVFQGVPAVIANQFKISDEAAINLADTFYLSLADQYPVNAALAEARKKIYFSGNHIEWGTPVLFMRSPDGYLFEVKSREPALPKTLPQTEPKTVEAIQPGEKIQAGIQVEKVSGSEVHIAGRDVKIINYYMNQPALAQTPTQPDSAAPPPVVAAVHILHISDLHLGTQGEAQLYRTQLMIDLRRELEIEKLHYLVISGDLTQRAQQSEFEAALAFVLQVMKQMDLDAGRVIVVPGNHDVNLEAAQEAYEFIHNDKWTGPLQEGLYIPAGEAGILMRNEARYRRRFENFNQYFYRPLTGRDYPPEYALQSEILKFPNHRLLFLAMNSAWEIDHHFRNRGSINPEALSRAIDNLVDEDLPGWVKIAVWHHPAAGRESMPTGLMDLLAANGFQVSLHGHLHGTQEGYYDYQRERDMHVIAAGTFGAPASEQQAAVPLQYNLIKLDAQTQTATVETRRKETPLGVWLADARWGSSRAPKPSYSLDIHWEGIDPTQPAPYPGMIYVPAGAFRLGTEMWPNERPAQMLHLEGFYLARYPVTNQEFRSFVESNGYTSRGYWTAEGWQWVQQHRKLHPRPFKWNEIHWAEHANHPVQWLSWYEALAYTRWLAELRNAPYRLPTEAEWEKAASWNPRTGEKYQYPWGNEDHAIQSLCNINGQWTTPVGLYSPAGDSPYGLADMAGQVWEWTSSLRWPYPYDPNDGRENLEASGERVFRGGSWPNSSGYGRTAGRYDANRPTHPWFNTDEKLSGPCGLRVAIG